MRSWVQLGGLSPISGLALGLALLGSREAGASGNTQGAPRSVAFHYGGEPPLELMSVFDWAVLDPLGVPTASAAARVAPALPIAYLGVGETHGGAPWSRRIDERWVLGRNPSWGGRIMDVASPRWRALLLEEIVPEIFARGFKGLFLDALDSHVAVLPAGAERDERWAALAALIKALRVRFPEAVLIANRGFEVLDEVAPALTAVAAESLFAGYDPAAERYREVSKNDRAWLSGQLGRARALGLPTIVIDYLPPRRRAEARSVAARIAAEGHIPWVAPAELDGLGVGALEVLPREVLLLYDGRSQADVAFSAAHRHLALPLEHLGLVPRYLDVREPLPARRLSGEIAGVVAWLDGRPLERPSRYRALLERQLADGVPIVLFGTLGPELDEGLLATLGLARRPVRASDGVVVHVRSPLLGFEAEPRGLAYDLAPISVAKGEGFEPLLELEASPDGNREPRDLIRLQPVALAPWGGVAFQPHAVATGIDGEGRWVLDPFGFLERALRIPVAPVVDPTTENGRRLLVSHIDGDGAASRSELPGAPLAITVVRRFLERWPFAHTVSVVEGEIAPYGLHPELSAELEEEARRIFRLPHVEPASHGFSHPFEWSVFESGGSAHLPVGAGTPSLEREIRGSLAYVSRLAGRPASVFLWTGDALPGPRSLAEAQAAGARSMNGGFTIITRDRPSVTHVGPRGRPVGAHFHVYAPILNEHVYTGGWSGPFWGYRRVRETFDGTGRPRRLSPIGIYWHFFSGTRRASLRALEQVYEDALRRAPLPIHASTWIDKVHEARRAVIARRLDGRFVVEGVAAVRNLRLPSASPFADLERSEGVLGLRATDVGTFAHLDGRGRALVALSDAPPAGVQLVEASARLVSGVRRPGVLRLELEGPAPASLTVKRGRCAPARGSSDAWPRLGERLRVVARSKEGLRYRLEGTTRVLCREHER